MRYFRITGKHCPARGLQRSPRQAAPRASHACLWLLLAPTLAPAAVDDGAVLVFLEQRVRADPLDNVAQNRLAFELMNAMRNTGELAYLPRAERAARASLNAVPEKRNPAALTLLAAVMHESHRFKEALALATRAHEIDPDDLAAALAIGDAQRELGAYAAADKSYAELAKTTNLPALRARRARLLDLRGESAQAIAMLTQILANSADDSLVLRLQLSDLHFRAGDFEQAQAQLEAAQKLDAGHFAVQDRLAELRAAQGRFPEATAIYRTLIARLPRPELMQALGDVYAFAGQADEAQRWHAQALQGYLQSVREGNVYYYHHLAGFYSDSQPDPAQALRWARKDMELRGGIHAHDSLAWALYRAGDYAAAAKEIDMALAERTRDAHVLSHAAMIYSRAGRMPDSMNCMREAAVVNPRYNTFHVHR